jgi:ADP-ribosylation factor-binding protein GGA
VATILLNSRPRIQKWISDAESDDPESLGTFIFLLRDHLSYFILDTYLQTNDQINSVLTRYEAFKRGETPPASIPAEFLPGKNEPLSLIDFDDATSQPGSGSGAGSSSKPADDLASLFESSASLTYTPATSTPVARPSGGPLVPNVNNQQAAAIPPQLSSPFPGTSTPSSRPQSQFGQIKLPSTPPLQNQLQGSGRGGSPSTISPMAPARASPSSNLAATSIPQQPLVPQSTSLPPISQVSTLQGKDPFADLAGLF